MILHGLGLFYSESGDYEKAADCESAYAALAPGNAGAYPRAIQLYLRARKPRSAIEAARKALAGENRAEVHQLLGKAYEMDGQPAEAVREMREAIRLNPYDESCYFDLSRDLLGSNRPQDAIQLLEDGKKIFASSAQLELALGVAYYAMRRFPDTVAAFLRTIQIDPRAEQPYIFLGRMLEQTEDKLPLVTAAFAALAKRAENYLASLRQSVVRRQRGRLKCCCSNRWR